MEAPKMQFAWGEMERVQPMQANLLKQLLTLGLSPALCERIIHDVADKALGRHGWLEALKRLADMIPLADDDVMTHGGVVSLLGPTGVGKTTTIAKLAARFALRHGRRNIVLVTTDSFRIGAHEQLRTYGRILGVPVQIANDGDELRAVLNHAGDTKLTLIDTAGVSQRDVRLGEQLATLAVEGMNIRNYLVLSATSQMSLQEDVINAFSKIGLHGCMLTKIDEASSLGEILSVLIQYELPLAYISDGQKVPDNLHPARGKQLVKEAVTLMQKIRKTLTQEQLAYRFGEMVNNEHV
jgi:flagellar biosynthesis protein FlhF